MFENTCDDLQNAETAGLLDIFQLSAESAGKNIRIIFHSHIFLEAKVKQDNKETFCKARPAPLRCRRQRVSPTTKKDHLHP